MRERDTRHLGLNDSLIGCIAANMPQATANATWDITDRDSKRGPNSAFRDMNPCSWHAANFSHVTKAGQHSGKNQWRPNPNPSLNFGSGVSLFSADIALRTNTSNIVIN